MSLPPAYHVGSSALLETSELDADITADPRGFAFLYEPPISQAKYILGLDPSVGITNWTRAGRTDNDHRTDNGAIEIFRVDAFRLPVLDSEGKPVIDPQTKQPRYITQDLQVAEYAAPVDAVEIARVANILGRIYGGDGMDSQCELILEVYPGPGMLTIQELLRLGYTNLWQWEYLDGVVEQTSRIGWRSNQQTQRLLWFRARHHLMGRQVIVRSKALLEEYSNAVVDVDLARAKAAYGSHDDRIQAASMAFWAGHSWAYDVESTVETVSESPVHEAQRQAPVLGDYRSYKDQWTDAVEGWD